MSNPYGTPKTDEQRKATHKEMYGDNSLPERGTSRTSNTTQEGKKLSFIQRVINALDMGLWVFVRLIHSSNHDYPYHDTFHYTDEEEEAPKLHYVVGENNRNANGDQHKYFVSKRTLIWWYDADTQIRVNHGNNVRLYGRPTATFNPDVGLKVYFLELHTNISEIFVQLGAEDTIDIYCEGVLPQEARDAE